ncbi:MAG: methylenetetrahydrofolate reductase [Chloroflexi bacterium]|nr:methylenetetrahydrofolate reductase [Chloroflexota bacterium]MCL5110826.1 methylenetetrahydrofolate reductase [Chloroflexota bacterium]
MGKLMERLTAAQFAVTAEIGPPKGVNLEETLRMADLLGPLVDAVNVTDQQSAVMRVGSLATCRLLVERGIEPVFQLTCRDRNRIALQSDLLSAAVLGVENVLCLTGDYVTLGDHPQAKPVFDLDSVSLLHAASELTLGRDLAGKTLTGAPAYFLGATVSPGAEPLEPQIQKMEMKVKAGARFFQTQAVYDTERFARFIRDTHHLGVPIMAGIVLLKSAGMARFMNSNVAGVNVPEPLIAEMDGAKSKRQKSVEIAARLINELGDICQGVHIMPIGWEQLVPDVLVAAGLREAVPT